MSRQETVILVAFVVETEQGPNDVEESQYRRAERLLTEKLHPLLQSQDESSPIDSWWIAGDERYDGSDCDSAIFVTPGNAGIASRMLFDAGLTPDYNIVTVNSPWEATVE